MPDWVLLVSNDFINLWSCDCHKLHPTFDSLHCLPARQIHVNTATWSGRWLVVLLLDRCFVVTPAVRLVVCQTRPVMAVLFGGGNGHLSPVKSRHANTSFWFEIDNCVFVAGVNNKRAERHEDVWSCNQQYGQQNGHVVRTLSVIENWRCISALEIALSVLRGYKPGRPCGVTYVSSLWTPHPLTPTLDPPSPERLYHLVGSMLSSDGITWWGGRSAFTLSQYFLVLSFPNTGTPQSHSSSSCSDTGNAYMQRQGIPCETQMDLWINEIALLVIAGVFTVLAYVQLKRVAKPR